MVKIKTNLFESIVAAIILPNTGLFLTTSILIISLFVKQESVVYRWILISYIACVLLMLVSLIISLLINKRSSKVILINSKEIVFNNYRFGTDQIRLCEYYVCKWYALPIVFFYKQQAGGSFTIKLKSGEKIHFKILYRDYQKISKYIKNIILK